MRFFLRVSLLFSVSTFFISCTESFRIYPDDEHILSKEDSLITEYFGDRITKNIQVKDLPSNYEVIVPNQEQRNNLFYRQFNFQVTRVFICFPKDDRVEFFNSKSKQFLNLTKEVDRFWERNAYLIKDINEKPK